MPPFQLYVFVSFLFFLTLTWVTRTGVQSSNTVADAEKAGMETKANKIIESAREEGVTAEIDVFSGKINTEGLLPGDDVQHELDSIRTHGSEMDKFIFSQIERMTNDPASFFTSAITIFSWSLFFLMPVFAVLLMWFFRRKGYYYTSYLIFSINLHTFLFFSLLIYILIFLLLGSNLHGILTLFLLLLFLVYEFVALRRTYGGKKRRIFFKLLVLNFSYLILLFVSGLGVLAAAFFTF